MKMDSAILLLPHAWKVSSLRSSTRWDPPLWRRVSNNGTLSISQSLILLIYTSVQVTVWQEELQQIKATSGCSRSSKIMRSMLCPGGATLLMILWVCLRPHDLCLFTVQASFWCVEFLSLSLSLSSTKPCANPFSAIQTIAFDIGFNLLSSCCVANLIIHHRAYSSHRMSQFNSDILIIKNINLM